MPPKIVRRCRTISKLHIGSVASPAWPKIAPYKTCRTSRTTQPTAFNTIHPCTGCAPYLSSPSSSGLDSLAQQSCHSCGCHDDRDAVEVEEVDDLLSVWLCPADCTPLHWVSWLIGSGVHNAAENADIIGHAAKLTPGYTRVFFISGRTFVTYCCH